MSTWFVARIHVGGWGWVSSIELDKLYFFIAVSVIDPTATPARKSNAQISFSQIEHTSIPPILSPRSAYQPIFDTCRYLSPTWQTFLQHFPGTCYFIHSLPFHRRLRPRVKNCSRQKWARENRAEYRDRYYKISSRMVADVAFNFLYQCVDYFLRKFWKVKNI